MTTPATGTPASTQPNQHIPANQQQRPNPFGSRPAASSTSFASRPGQNAPAASNAPAQGTNTGNNSPFGGSLLRRSFGNQNEALQWTVSPLGKVGVRIQLGGLGDPFHRLLGTPLNTEYGNPLKVVQALQQDDELREKLEKLLDEAWESYGFRGAAILYPWDAEVRKAFIQPPQPVQPPANPGNKKDDSNDDAEDDSWLDGLANAPTKGSCECLRAIDVLFVLNILARARTNILVANTQLALEPGFLEQVYVTDDPRIVALARATGCLEEVW